MGSLWLHDLDDWCREYGIPFREYPGWLTRSRSSGGFDALYGVVAHHTGSNTSWQNDCAYEWLNAATKPIGNVHLDRAGVFTLGAAGATNTNGRGIANWVCSKGTIPVEPSTMGNRMAIAIEAANNGVGEVWPRAQMDSYIRFIAMLCDKIRWNPQRDVNTHRGWAGTRKSDPFGPASGYPNLGGGTWSVPALRNYVDVLSPAPAPTPAPIPPPPAPSGRNHPMRLIKYGGTATGGWTGRYSFDGGVTARNVSSWQHWQSLISEGAVDARTLKPITDPEGDDVTWVASLSEADSFVARY